MKYSNYLILFLFILGISFTSCKKDEQLSDSGFPESFKVDIPSSISDYNTAKSTNELDGGSIYGHLRTFIKIGEGAAELVENIMKGIGQHHLSQPLSFTFTGEDDGREKSCDVIEDSEFENLSWEYQMTIKDVLSKGIAMQVFWNKSPVKGIAIINLYNMNRTINDAFIDEQTIFRVDYSEAEKDYDQQMIVYISDLVLPSNQLPDDKFGMETLKLFAGKKGNIVDVYGNSNHPYAWLFDNNNVGFNWAFVASGDLDQNIGVAEVGLPPSTLDETSRTVLLGTYAIHAVFEQELQALGLPQADIDAALVNALPPGYFANGGFIQAGTSPGTSYATVEANIADLAPFNPVTVSQLKVTFKPELGSVK